MTIVRWAGRVGLLLGFAGCGGGGEGESSSFGTTVSTSFGTSVSSTTSAGETTEGGESTSESTSSTTGGESTSGPVDTGPQDSESGGPVCGDGVMDPTEMCDGDDVGDSSCAGLGLGGGPLGCLPDCSNFDTSGCMNQSQCGNAIKDGIEQCDGADLGGQTCMTLGYDMGVLSCSATCMLVTTGCMDMICTPNFGDCTEVPCCEGLFCYPIDGHTCGPQP